MGGYLSRWSVYGRVVITLLCSWLGVVHGSQILFLDHPDSTLVYASVGQSTLVIHEKYTVGGGPISLDQMESGHIIIAYHVDTSNSGGVKVFNPETEAVGWVNVTGVSSYKFDGIVATGNQLYALKGSSTGGTLYLFDWYPDTSELELSRSWVLWNSSGTEIITGKGLACGTGLLLTVRAMSTNISFPLARTTQTQSGKSK